MAQLPNPFWSDAVQQEFQRAKAESTGIRDSAVMREVDDTQQEPDYQQPLQEQANTSTVGMTHPAQEGFEAGLSAGEQLDRDEVSHQESPVAAFRDPAQASPGPRSTAGLSDFSNMERGARVRVDDQELVPDYSTMPSMGMQAHTGFLSDMSNMMTELMKLQLAPVVERLERLESASTKSSEVSAIPSLNAAERMTTAKLEHRVAAPPQALMPAPLMVAPSSSSQGIVSQVDSGMIGDHGNVATREGRPVTGSRIRAIESPPEIRGVDAPDVQMEALVGSENIGFNTGRGQHQEHQGGEMAGIVEIDGTKYAWRVTPEGLKLESPGCPSG